MRVKNKEIRRRRHRKEQTIKAAEREIRAKYSGDKKPTTAGATAVAKKPAVAKAAPAAKKPTPKAKKAEA